MNSAFDCMFITGFFLSFFISKYAAVTFCLSHLLWVFLFLFFLLKWCRWVRAAISSPCFFPFLLDILIASIVWQWSPFYSSQMNNLFPWLFPCHVRCSHSPSPSRCVHVCVSFLYIFFLFHSFAMPHYYCRLCDGGKTAVAATTSHIAHLRFQQVQKISQ